MKTLVKIKFNLSYDDLEVLSNPQYSIFWGINMEIYFGPTIVFFRAEDLDISYPRHQILSLEAEVYER